MNNYLNIFSLEGKKAAVTGGTSALGSCIAKGFGKAGAEVAICGRDSTKREKIVEDLKREGIEAKGYYIDVMEKGTVISCHEEVMNDFGRVDILLNAVGGNVKEATTSEDLSFFELPLSGLEKVVRLNFFGGIILPCQIFGRSMVENKEGGSIINISSLNAFRPLTKIPGYSAAKAAVSNFTQWLAIHLAREYTPKLRVNAIAPGFILTKQNRHLLLDRKNNLTSRGQAAIRHTPIRRFGEPSDLIGICIWLASDAARFVSGVVIPIDGGFSCFSGV